MIRVLPCSCCTNQDKGLDKQLVPRPSIELMSLLILFTQVCSVVAPLACNQITSSRRRRRKNTHNLTKQTAEINLTPALILMNDCTASKCSSPVAVLFIESVSNPIPPTAIGAATGHRCRQPYVYLCVSVFD